MCIVCASGLQLTEGGYSGRAGLDHPDGATTVSDYRALAASSWNRNPWSNDFGIIPGRGAFISFSFEVGPTSQAVGYGAAFAASFTAWTPAQLASARQALALWGEASGITFLEVPAGRGDIRFAGNYDFNLGGPYNSSQAAAYAGFPNLSGGSEIFFGRSTYDSLQIFLHEIGHSLGLKHPFDGEFVLSAADDNYAQSIMSYTRGGLPGDRLGTLDVVAIQYLYGTPDRDGTQVSAWSWNAQTHTLSQTGSAGADFIRGIGGNNLIDGGAGNDDISAQNGSSTILGGDGNDRISTGAGNDTIEGGAGNDQIELRGGQDRVLAGDGDDFINVQWSAGARFVVDGGAGSDVLTIAADYFSTAPLTFNLAFLADTGSSYVGIERVAISGGRGNDVIHLAGGNESASGSDGNDRLYGLGGNDSLSGGSGDDLLDGGDGDDNLVDGVGNDTLVGGAGNDGIQVTMGGVFAADGGTGSDYLLLVAAGSAGANYSLAAAFAAGATAVNIENIYLYGGSQADRMTGSSRVEYIAGYAGNDILMGLGGSDTIVGGDGVDTAVYAGLRGGYSAVSQTRVAGGREGGADTLQTVERLKFLDGTISYETGTAVWIQDEATIAVARLYQVCLGRTPDLGGLEHYRNAVDQGYDLMHFTKSMIESPEFISRFGTLTNQQFVEQVYRFVLGREGDAVGVSGYVAALSQGYTRADVVLVFSESPENKARYQTTWETQVRTLENGRYPATATDDTVLPKGDGAQVLWGEDDPFLPVPHMKDDIVVVCDDILISSLTGDASDLPLPRAWDGAWAEDALAPEGTHTGPAVDWHIA